MRILGLWMAIVGSLLTATAGAQTAIDAPGICETYGLAPSGYYVDYTLDAWPKEAQRIQVNERLVSRQYDELRLVLDGGKTIELRDCPYTDASYVFRYERYDQAGRFYVVERGGNEDLSYVLVMRKTGRLFRVEGLPIWTSEKSKFLTVGCSMLPPRGELVIHTLAGDGFATEAEFPLPCDSESCSARWDNQSRISVACTPYGGGSKKGTEFVLTRNKDGAWNRFDR